MQEVQQTDAHTYWMGFGEGSARGLMLEHPGSAEWPVDTRLLIHVPVDVFAIAPARVQIPGQQFLSTRREA